MTGAQMDEHGRIKRRDFLATTAAVAGGVASLAAATASPARGETALPQGIHTEDPLAQYWQKAVSDLIEVKPAAELTNDVVRERHRIYSLLLMVLILRFWNGNDNGPLGIYPQREGQKAPGQAPNADYYRYMGDMHKSNDDPQRVSWDRYLGHNIACLAVDVEMQ